MKLPWPSIGGVCAMQDRVCGCVVVWLCKRGNGRTVHLQTPCSSCALVPSSSRCKERGKTGETVCVCVLCEGWEKLGLTKHFTKVHENV